MARELYPTNRGLVLVGNEPVYGAGAVPAMTAADVVYAEDVTVDTVTDMITRQGASPERPGFRAVAGLEHGTLSLSTECRPKVQTVPLADADAPDIDKLLRAAGWVREDSDATVSQTYVATSGYTVESAQVQIFETNSDQAGAGAGMTVWDFFGVRFDWSFTWNAGERWMWAFTGAANGFEQGGEDIPAAWYNLLGPLNYGIDEPLTAKGLTGNGLAETEGDPAIPFDATTRVIFGGGITGAPLHELAVLSVSVSGNMGMNEQESVTSSGGIGRITLVPQDALTIECVVEQSGIAAPPAGEWNPYLYRDTQDPIEVNFTFTQTGTGANVVSAQVVAYAVITGVSKAESNGRNTWSLTMEAVYPESANDTGLTTAAGEDPGQVFEIGPLATPSIGLGLIGTTRRGLMAIQFSTI